MKGGCGHTTPRSKRGFPYPIRVLAAMREADFQAWVVDVAKRFGWKVWHVPAPMRATKAGTWVGAREAAGLPDLIMLHDDPPRLIFAEVKGTGGKLSDEQREFLQAAGAVAEWSRDHTEYDPPRNMGAYLWQPGMEQQIEDLLRSKVLA
jgi:hypothetical protein